MNTLQIQDSFEPYYRRPQEHAVAASTRAPIEKAKQAKDRIEAAPARPRTQPSRAIAPPES